MLMMDVRAEGVDVDVDPGAGRAEPDVAVAVSASKDSKSKKYAILKRLGGQGDGEEVLLRLSSDETYTFSRALWNLPERSERTNVVLCNNPGVGNAECCFFLEDDCKAHTIEALSNKLFGGTFVNGDRLNGANPKRVLKSGDLISLGGNFTEEDAIKSDRCFVSRYEVDESPGETKHDVTKIPLNKDVILEICEYLSPSEIRNCRFLNKDWSAAGMSALKKKTTFKMSCSLSATGLQDLESMRKKMQKQGFSHGKIHIDIRTTHRLVSEDLPPKFVNFFNTMKMSWNINELRITTGLVSTPEWELFSNLLAIFGNSVGCLNLNLKIQDELRWNQGQETQRFSNVKNFIMKATLKKAARSYTNLEDDSFENFAKWLIRSMPNLVKVQMPGDIAHQFFWGAVTGQPRNLKTLIIGPPSGLYGRYTNMLGLAVANFDRFKRSTALYLPQVKKVSLCITYDTKIEDILAHVSTTLEVLHVELIEDKGNHYFNKTFDLSLPKLRELQWKCVYPIPKQLLFNLNYAQLPMLETLILEPEFRHGFLQESNWQQWEKFLDSAFPRTGEVCKSLKMLRIPKPDLLNQLPTLFSWGSYWQCDTLSDIYGRTHRLFPNAATELKEAKIFNGITHYHTCH